MITSKLNVQTWAQNAAHKPVTLERFMSFEAPILKKFSKRNKIVF